MFKGVNWWLVITVFSVISSASLIGMQRYRHKKLVNQLHWAVDGWESCQKRR